MKNNSITKERTNPASSGIIRSVIYAVFWRLKEKYWHQWIAKPVIIYFILVIYVSSVRLWRLCGYRVTRRRTVEGGHLSSHSKYFTLLLPPPGLTTSPLRGMGRVWGWEGNTLMGNNGCSAGLLLILQFMCVCMCVFICVFPSYFVLLLLFWIRGAVLPYEPHGGMGG